MNWDIPTYDRSKWVSCLVLLIICHWILLLTSHRYNVNTGEFTVPSGGGGLYYFSTFLTFRVGVWCHVQIKKNGLQLCNVWGDNQETTDDHMQASYSAIANVLPGSMHFFEELNRNVVCLLNLNLCLSLSFCLGCWIQSDTNLTVSIKLVSDCGSCMWGSIPNSAPRQHEITINFICKLTEYLIFLNRPYNIIWRNEKLKNRQFWDKTIREYQYHFKCKLNKNVPNFKKCIFHVFRVDCIQDRSWCRCNTCWILAFHV